VLFATGYRSTVRHRLLKALSGQFQLCIRHPSFLSNAVITHDSIELDKYFFIKKFIYIYIYSKCLNKFIYRDYRVVTTPFFFNNFESFHRLFE